MSWISRRWPVLGAVLMIVGLLGLAPFGGAALANQGASVAADDPSLTLTTGSYSVSYSPSGGSQIGSLPQNLSTAGIPNVAVIKTGKPGLEFRVTQCPNETDEHFFDRVDEFSHKVWAKWGEPPVITPGG